MSRKQQRNAAKEAHAAMQSLNRMRKNILTADGYNNVMVSLGISANNMSAGGTYDFGGFITRQRLVLEAAYRTSWIVGQVVDVVAQDMTREGAEINCDFTPDDLDTLQRANTQMGNWGALTNAIKWGRLYGGAVAIIMIQGQKMDSPLDINTIGRGSFKGLLVLDRWLVNPSLGDLVSEYGPNFGMPKYYDIISSSLVLPAQKVHHSRVLRFDGIELPYLWKQAENMWSESVCERMWDRLLAFDSVTQGAAQLVYKAHLRTVQVEGLREILAAGGIMEQALIKQFDHIRRFQSNEGITLLDSKDVFNTHQYTFSGLSDLILQFGQQISGSTGIPLVRLFGQSPAGLNATGETDIRNYYDTIAQLQERTLKAPLLKVIRCLCMSLLGKPFPETGSVEFSPLWQMSDEQKSSIAAKDAETVNGLYNSDIISKATALKELKQHSRITGRFTNITDEDIAKAEQEPELPKGEGLEFQPGDSEEGEDAPATGKANTALKKVKDALLSYMRRVRS